MPRIKNFDLLREKVLARPGAKERVESLRRDLLAEVGLNELRRSQDMSQVELAEALHVTQGAISKFENADDVRLSTLRQYVEGLGGHLEVLARFPDQVVAIGLKGAQMAVSARPAASETTGRIGRAAPSITDRYRAALDASDAGEIALQRGDGPTTVKRQLAEAAAELGVTVRSSWADASQRTLVWKKSAKRGAAAARRVPTRRNAES